MYDYRKLSNLPPITKKRRLAEPVQLSDCISRVDDLFKCLTSELENLQAPFSSESISVKSYYSAPTTPIDIVNLWKNQVESTQLLSNVLETLGPDSINTQFIQFRIMQKITSTLPALHMYRQKEGIIMRAINREVCRSLVILVDWILDVEPKLIQRLLHVHRFHGFLGLQKEAPAFAQLVDHVVQYVHFSILSHVKKPSSKSMSYSNPSPGFGPPFQSTKVPKDMYGLWSCKPSPSSCLTLDSVKLPKNSRNVTISDLYDHSAKILSGLWTTNIIIPQLRSIDHEHSKGKYGKDKDNCILQRSITRGVILSCISEVCEGDGIFASLQMDNILLSPALMFNLTTDQRFVPAIRKRRDEVLGPFRDYLQALLVSNPEVDLKHTANSLGEFITRRMVELHIGGPLLQDEETDTNQQKPKTAVKMLQKFPMAAITPQNLLQPGLSSPKFELLAVIIREALNKKRSLDPADNILCAVLNGKHPTQISSKQYNPDQTNPIREFSSGAGLFRKHLPGCKLTTKVGLSNLLSWMSTGQGNFTKGFLDNIYRPCGFFAESLEEMVQTFQDAMNQNAQLVASLEHDYNPKEDTFCGLQGYIKYDDMEIWGQPNNLLSVAPTIPNRFRGSKKRKLTPTEKFSPFWNERLQDQWVEFLGDMLNQDPSTWNGKKKGWSDVLTFISNLGLNVFKKGLTLLQTANNIAFSEIVNQPSTTHIAHWITRNSSLGAFHGLEELGFCLSSPDTVYAAMSCVYGHLDTDLSDADKAVLGFGNIQIEHILCKVPRWKRRLLTARVPNHLEKIAEDAVRENPVFIPGANEYDNKALPFSHTMGDDAMKKYINKMVVCIMSLVLSEA